MFDIFDIVDEFNKLLCISPERKQLILKLLRSKTMNGSREFEELFPVRGIEIDEYCNYIRKLVQSDELDIQYHGYSVEDYSVYKRNISGCLLVSRHVNPTDYQELEILGFYQIKAEYNGIKIRVIFEIEKKENATDEDKYSACHETILFEDQLTMADRIADDIFEHGLDIITLTHHVENRLEERGIGETFIYGMFLDMISDHAHLRSTRNNGYKLIQYPHRLTESHLNGINIVFKYEESSDGMPRLNVITIYDTEEDSYF